MSKAIIVGDIHLSDKAPSSRKNTYAIEITDKILWISDLAKKKNVPIVLAGDVFHIKTPGRNSHWLVQAVHDALQGVPTFIVPGNHDLQHDRLDSLPSQPLGSLAKMSNVELLMGYHPDLPGIMGVPYLNKFDPQDDEMDPDDSGMLPWGYALREWYATLDYEPPPYRMLDGDEVSHYGDLIVTHAPLFPPGEEPGVYNYIRPYDWAKFWSHDGPTNTYYGHIHDCHGTYQVEGHTFCNQGALSRGSLHEATINRKPAVTYWDEYEFTRIEVPHKAPEEVYLFDEAIERAIKQANNTNFSDAIGRVRLKRLTLTEVLATLRRDVSEPEVLKVIEQSLEDAQ